MNNKLSISIFLTIFSFSILADLSKPTSYSKDLYPTPILTGKYNESIDHPDQFLHKVDEYSTKLALNESDFV
jgi:hypothetical protein